MKTRQIIILFILMIIDFIIPIFTKYYSCFSIGYLSAYILSNSKNKKKKSRYKLSTSYKLSKEVEITLVKYNTHNEIGFHTKNEGYIGYIKLQGGK